MIKFRHISHIDDLFDDLKERVSIMSQLHDDVIVVTTINRAYVVIQPEDDIRSIRECYIKQYRSKIRRILARWALWLLKVACH